MPFQWSNGFESWHLGKGKSQDKKEDAQAEEVAQDALEEDAPKETARNMREMYYQFMREKKSELAGLHPDWSTKDIFKEASKLSLGGKRYCADII